MITTSKSYANYVVFVQSKAKTYFAALCGTISAQSYAASVPVIAAPAACGRRAVFFNRLGEIRDRSYENQRRRASGLNLLVAAIMLWNTTYSSALSITYGSKGTIRHPVIWLICRHSAGTI